MAIIQERYHAKPIGVNGSILLVNDSIGGFIAITAGTITVTYASGAVMINALPVLAGVYYPLPFLLGPIGGTVTLAGGASGVLGV